jgi:SAM-dependent methyltransferase
MLSKIIAFIYANINWIGVDFVDPSMRFEATNPAQNKSVRVLDYACGPGTITHAIGNRATEYIGIDLSENMVQAYNVRFNPETADADGGDEPLNAHAVVGNLLTTEAPPEELSGPEYHDFDLVVVGMGFHHFSDVRLASKRLAERLRPGGVFLILDLATHAMEVEETEELTAVKNTVAHHGFDEQELRDIFAGAGLSDFAIVRMKDYVYMRGTSKRQVFMAKGSKI